MTRKVAGVTSDGVKILEPIAKPTSFTRAEARKAVRDYLAKVKSMSGGGWNYPKIGFIRTVMWASKTTAVSYGEAGWPSQSYRLWCFEQEP